ncbi:hypothetical protein P7C71_g3526, partial [Lecanoromycetidae sp. Uapishka_2]
MNNAAAAAALVSQVPVPALTDSLWQAHAQRITSGIGYDISIATNIANIIGDDGIAVIATRFRYLIQAPVTTIHDPSRGLVTITPSRNPSGHETIMPEVQKPKAKTSKQAKVARPPNAFILYRQHHHPLVKAQNPELHNNQISVILGTQWKNEREDIKNQFVKLAKQIKAKHLHEHPDYHYQPRKPSEKKRRMTRRKAAALASAKSMTPLSPTFAETKTASTSSEAAPSAPELTRTLGGNVELELGDEDMDDNALAAMLEQYNNSVPQINNPIVTGIIESTPPVIYDEPTEEAQNDSNYYSSMHNFNPFMTDEELSNELNMFDMDSVTKDDIDAFTFQFDQQQESNFDAELQRMDNF